MKKTLLALLLFFFPLSSFAFESNLTKEVEMTPSLQLEGSISDEGLLFTWKEWEGDFLWYKLLWSQSNPDPIYPDDSSIFYSADRESTTYLNATLPLGKSFYRLCVITPSWERYCSNVFVFEHYPETENNCRKEPLFDKEYCGDLGVCSTSDSQGCPVFFCCNTPPLSEKQPPCEEGEFFATNPEGTVCTKYQNTCDIPKDSIPQETCPEEILSFCERGIPYAFQGEIHCREKEEDPCNLCSDQEKCGINQTFPPEVSCTSKKDNISPSKEEKEEGKNKKEQIASDPNPEKDLISFTDVSRETEQGRAIMEYASKGVINGFSDGTFGGEKTVTRAEIAKITTLASGHNPDPPSTPIFCDVPVSEWFAPFVHYFSENGYAQGFVGGDCSLQRYFSPHNPVLRGEAIKMIFEILGIEVSLLEKQETTGFPDVAPDHWLAPYARKAWEENIFRGYDDGNFYPNIPATRGEIILFLKRAEILKKAK